MKKLVLATALLVTMIAVFGVIGLVTTGESADPTLVLVPFEQLRRERVVYIEDHDLYVVEFKHQVVALDSDAQHLGDEVIYCDSSEMFESLAHGEKFDILGNYFGGPGSQGLDRYVALPHGDAVHVDLERPIRGPERDEHRPRPPQGPLCVPT